MFRRDFAIAARPRARREKKRGTFRIISPGQGGDLEVTVLESLNIEYFQALFIEIMGGCF